MAVIIKPKPSPVSSPVQSLDSLRSGNPKNAKKTNLPSSIAEKLQLKNQEERSSINNDIIKPKYLKDTSVVYKSSGYIKDLLGEGN